MQYRIYIIVLLLFVFAKKINGQNTAADSLFNAKQWENAIIAYTNYLQTNPKDRPGFQWNRIGQCYYNLNQTDKAIDAYKKAVAYNGNSTIMYNIACAYNKLAQKDSALTWLDKSATAGFTQYKNTLDDEDLKSLHDDTKFKTIIDKMKKAVSPCSFQPESQQFNFWIGEWKVYNQQGQQSGTSKIEQILNECVILENWTDYFGNKGKSFNFYNSETKQWQQTWVDDKGSVTEFINGKYIDNAMRFQSSRPIMSNGKKGIRRLTFFKISDNEVRQFGEVSTDKGKTWKTEYDLKYIREK
ncbi:MAG: tetratricopeptide repeat protein [Chitinophagales bacterium]